MEVKTWSVRGEKKDEVRKRKTKMQRQFRERMGLVEDQPRAGGAGTLNDGNTAWRAFRDPKTFSETTGVDEIIKRLAVILNDLQSQERVVSERFDEYAMETAEFTTTCGFYMPAGIHELLVHGTTVIETLLLPTRM